MDRSRALLASVVVMAVACGLGISGLFWYELRGYSLSPVATGMFKSSPVWVFKSQNAITASPVTDGGTVFLRTAQEVCALNATTGMQSWCVSSPSPAPLALSPYLFGEYLAIPEKGSIVTVAAQNDGRILWRAAPRVGGPPGMESEEIRAIAASEGELFVVRFNWKLTSYDLRTGKVLWEQWLRTHASPYMAVDSTTVYLGIERHLQAFERISGRLSWDMDLDSYVGQLHLDTRTGYLYVADAANTRVLAIKPDAHSVVWTAPVDSAGDIGSGCLAEVQGGLLVASEELILLLPSTGDQIWRSNRLGRLECPISLDDKIFVRTSDKVLYELDKGSGQELGRLTVQANAPVPHQPNRSPVVVDGMLIVPVSERELRAYRP